MPETVDEMLVAVHELTIMSDTMVEKLTELDREYAQDPLTNWEKRRTIDTIIALLNAQSSAIRQFAEAHASNRDQLEALVKKYLPE